MVATATDAADNVGTANATLAVVDPTDTSAPTVTISAPQRPGRDHVANTGDWHVNDSHIVSWTLDEAPENGSKFTTIATGTSNVAAGGKLGSFDPTTLAERAVYTPPDGLERGRACQQHVDHCECHGISQAGQTCSCHLTT